MTTYARKWCLLSMPVRYIHIGLTPQSNDLQHRTKPRVSLFFKKLSMAYYNTSNRMKNCGRIKNRVYNSRELILKL